MRAAFSGRVPGDTRIFHDHRNDLIRLHSRGKRRDRLGLLGLNAPNEVIDLRRVFLTAEVIPDFVRQLRRLENFPAELKRGVANDIIAKKKLDFLPINGKAAIGTPNSHLSRQLPITFVAPI